MVRLEEIVPGGRIPEKPEEKPNQDDSAHVPDGKTGDDEQSGTTGTTQKRPRRFFGSITLDPDKAGLQVAKIAEEILFELTLWERRHPEADPGDRRVNGERVSR